jgi:hypothetical protein
MRTVLQRSFAALAPRRCHPQSSSAELCKDLRNLCTECRNSDIGVARDMRCTLTVLSSFDYEDFA